MRQSWQALTAAGGVAEHQYKADAPLESHTESSAKLLKEYENRLVGVKL